MTAPTPLMPRHAGTLLFDALVSGWRSVWMGAVRDRHEGEPAEPTLDEPTPQ